MCQLVQPHQVGGGGSHHARVEPAAQVLRVSPSGYELLLLPVQVAPRYMHGDEDEDGKHADWHEELNAKLADADEGQGVDARGGDEFLVGHPQVGVVCSLDVASDWLHTLHLVKVGTSGVTLQLTFQVEAAWP
jgi:hypothetical protein